jgi:exosortase E/protease (VPEID-CTERM system)
LSSTVDAGWTRSGPSSSARRLLLWGGLVSLLVAELVVLTLPFDPTASVPDTGIWAAFLGAVQRGIRPTFITVAVASVFFSWPVLQREFHRVLDESPDRITSGRWFTAHLVLLALLILGTRAQATRLSSIKAWEGWLLLWIILSLAALLTWLFSALPPRFWIRWIARSRSVPLIAGAAGLAAYAFGNWTQELWSPLQRASFGLVATILGLFGEVAVNRPEELVIGTSRFVVRITPHCSGLEGIGLICAFIGIYLWTCRSELSFPQALLLFPIGAVAIWLLNSVRIASLIFIGGWDLGVALKGFHSAAGWILFNLVAVGLVWTSSQSKLFVKAPETRPTVNPATGYLLPLIVLLASSLMVRVLSPEFSLPAVALSVLLTLWYCRSTLLSLQWKPSWFSILAGCVVFIVTVLLSRNSATSGSIATSIQNLRATGLVALLMIALAGGALAMPMAQELAFRGYLARKLVASDFESIPFDRFTWLSFTGSSVAFGILQPYWLPGIFAGMVFAAAMYRRGLLSDAIIAHICSSAMLFALAAIAGKWSLLGHL